MTEDKTQVQDPQAIAKARDLSRVRLEPPSQIPGYRVLRRLGEGAFGSVWLAQEHNTGKNVAIKFYTHRRGLDWSLLSREVEKLAVLYTSRNIVGLLDVGWDGDPPFYIMEYLENGSLGSYLANGPLPPHEAVRVAKSILRALVHAHGSGILHCDLKPANVLLDANFEPRLCDFGQSRLSDEQDPALGTLFYMAPEQADLKAVPDARWDVYALGALLYQLLRGAPPHRTEENEQLIRSATTLEERLAIYRRIVRQSPKPNRHPRVPGVDKRLADIVHRCLHVDPQKRFPNAQAVLDMLDIRDRQRSRRPLIALGVFGPILLILALIPFVLGAMQKSRQAARQHLTERVLEGDVVSAKFLAHGIQRELEDRKTELAEIASDLPLRAAMETAVADSWNERSAVQEILHQWKTQVDQKRDQQNRQRDTSWFLTDGQGLQRWREQFDPNTLDKSWAHRDYFHGRHTEYPLDAVPDDIEPIREPHLSLAFLSQATYRYMVAITVPIWDLEGERVIGVLARTTHLTELLAQYEPSIHGNGGTNVDRVIALIDHRNGKLLAHPWMTEENLQRLSENKFDAWTVDSLLVKRLQQLAEDRDRPDAANQASRDDDYRDPVRHVGATTYGGEWLAAFWPVGETGWTAVVQERKEVALKPVEDLQAWLVRHALWSLVVSCALIAMLLLLVLHALNTRTLRNWPRSSRAENI